MIAAFEMAGAERGGIVIRNLVVAAALAISIGMPVVPCDGAATEPAREGATMSRKPNHLSGQTSPYLLQHAHNPVNWYAWGDEPFARARREGKLVVLSIGYSTCHWCHVMERESFEDEEVARYLNENFVCIKVDREERPDLDDVYLRAVRELTGDGGWPLTAFLTVDRRPFFGGTYFPRDAFLDVLRKLRDVQARQPDAITNGADRAVRAIQIANGSTRGALPGADAIELAVRKLAAVHDSTWGGFGPAPKFPQPPVLDLLLRVHRRTGDPAALAMVTTTLDRMAAGGIHDQLGGGFHRYATDERWLVPHFEIMLYDQAQLARVYLEAAQASGRADLADVAAGILDYLVREMRSPDGGFYSASDADSGTAAGDEVEGAYFTWTPAELDAALGPDLGREAAAYYGVTEAGDLDGRSILHVTRSVADVAAELGVRPAALTADLGRARALLGVARTRRPRPFVDDKVVTAWNGMAISALARGAEVLHRDDYADAATRAAELMLAVARGPDGRLRRALRAGVAHEVGMLDDYASLIEGFLDLAAIRGGPRWIDEAIALQHVVDREFADPAGGYFATPSGHEDLLVRDKPAYDGAEPSGNAITIANLLRLAELTGDEAWRRRAETTLAAFAGLLANGGESAPRMLGTVEALLDRPFEIVLVAPGRADELAPLAAAVAQVYLPNRTLIQVVDGPDLDTLERRVPWLEGKHALAGKPTAFVCERGACKFPTSDPAVLVRQLHDVRPLRPAPTP